MSDHPPCHLLLLVFLQLESKSKCDIQVRKMSLYTDYQTHWAYTERDYRHKQMSSS